MTKNERLNYLLEERKGLIAQKEGFEILIAEREGEHRELDALQEALTEVIDVIEISDREIRFLEGEGLTITLRILPMPWCEEGHPSTWDWQTLLDMPNVEVVQS
jgi:hypothetical protein